MYATALRSVASARSGPGVFATLKPPATICDRVAVGVGESRWDRCAKIPSGSMREDPVGIEALGSHWDRCRLIPEGSHTVAGGRRAAAHPRNSRTNAHRSRRDRRHICDRVAVGG